MVQWGGERWTRTGYFHNPVLGWSVCLTLKCTRGPGMGGQETVTLTQVPLSVKEQIKNLRHREVYSHASGHTASKWQS